jgi:hypothetical protein
LTRTSTQNHHILNIVHLNRRGIEIHPYSLNPGSLLKCKDYIPPDLKTAAGDNLCDLAGESLEGYRLLEGVAQADIAVDAADSAAVLAGDLFVGHFAVSWEGEIECLSAALVFNLK